MKGDVRHEVELAIMLKKGGTNIKLADWRSYIGGYMVAIDYTDTTLLERAKDKGEPWLLAKG